jgi:hypothetical protein
VFHRVISKAQRLGIYDILGMYQDWNTELVAQFCATAWRSGHGYDSTLNFSIEGHRFELKLMELPTIFAFTDNDFHRPEISTERTIEKMSWHHSTIPGMTTTLAQIVVSIPSTTSSTTSSATLSFPCEVIALASRAQQGTFS